ncbi:MAG: hypothetical protein RL846_01965 [Deltaproteobacteria bacterium]
MSRSWSSALASLGLAAWMLAPACVDPTADGNGAAALTNNQGDTMSPEGPQDPGPPGGPGMPGEPGMPGGPEGPEGPEPWPPEGGDLCEQLMVDVHVCYEAHDPLCGDLHEDLGACYESQFAPCEALMESVFDCEQAGGGCEPLRLQAEQCFEQAHQLCAAVEEAAVACMEPCHDLERELDDVCGRGPECPPGAFPELSTCDHLLVALDQCFGEHGPEACISIEAAVFSLCAGGPGGEPPPGEHYPPDAPPEDGDPEVPPGE